MRRAARLAIDPTTVTSAHQAISVVPFGP